MLMRNPKEFERVAREWAVKYAGSPQNDRAEGSGGATAATLKQREQKSKEEEEKARLAAFVIHFIATLSWVINLTVIK